MIHPQLSIVGFAGKARSGKSFAGKLLAQAIDGHCVGFADGVRQSAAATLGLGTEVYTEEWKSEVDPEWDLSGREILQRIGHGLRESLHPEVWIRSLRAHLEGLAECSRGTHLLVCICDVRYRNEVDAIRAWGGVVHYISRAGQGIRLVGAEAAHPSENDLSPEDFSPENRIINPGEPVEYLRILLRKVAGL